MKICRWSVLFLWSCAEPEPPVLDPVTGAHILQEVEETAVEDGRLSIAYSHDIQGETEPCG